jgi:cell division protein FtsB
MPEAAAPKSQSVSPGSPAPLRRRRAPAAPPAPAWRQRLLTYALAFVTVVLVADALVGDKGLLDTMRARRQYDAIAADLAQKKHENADLRDQIRRLRDDPSALEAIAREELGLMREGEMVFIVHDLKAAPR